MTCTVCDADLPTGALFCGECGSAVIARPARVAVARSTGGAADRGGEEPPPPLPPAPASPEPTPWRDALAPAPWFPPPAPSAPAEDSVAAAAADEHTRLPARAAAPAVRFVLQFSTGESVTVTGTGLIGRRPQAEPGEYFDHLVTIDDPGRSVSKTHLEFGQDGGSFWVSDRFSANGTVVREPDRAGRLAAPGLRSRVARGSRVEIGEQFFVVS